MTIARSDDEREHDGEQDIPADEEDQGQRVHGRSAQAGQGADAGRGGLARA
jgi:hypothetical protein